MNILQLRSEFSDNGPGSQTLTLSQELRRRGHNIHFCSSGGRLTDKIRSLGFKYHIIPELSVTSRDPISILKSLRRLRQVLASNDFDIIHTHNAANALLARLVAFSLGKKTTVFQSVRGVEVRKKYGWRNWIYRLNASKFLFAVSRFTKDTLVGFGVAENRIIITFNGTDLDRFNINKKREYSNEIRDEFNIPRDALVIGIIGRQDGFKGHRLLIEIFAELYHRYSNLYIVLVGAGSELSSNMRLANDLKVADRTIFAGLRLDPEKLHASFDIFSLLSKKGLEMFPNAIIEAMTYEVPFVSVNTTGVPETAAKGEGIICECDDKMEITKALSKLLSDESLRSSMGKKGRESVKQDFNVCSVVDKIEEAYNQ